MFLEEDAYEGDICDFSRFYCMLDLLGDFIEMPMALLRLAEPFVYHEIFLQVKDLGTYFRNCCCCKKEKTKND